MLLKYLVLLLIFIISSIPLYFAVKMLGGKTTILKTALIVFIAGLIITYLQGLFGFGSFIAFLLMIIIYRTSFRLGIIRALLAWLLQFVLIGIMIIIVLWIGIGLP